MIFKLDFIQLKKEMADANILTFKKLSEDTNISQNTMATIQNKHRRWKPVFMKQWNAFMVAKVLCHHQFWNINDEKIMVIFNKLFTKKWLTK